MGKMKHEILEEILKELGIDTKEMDLSTGSTVTKETLKKILSEVQRFDEIYSRKEEDLSIHIIENAEKLQNLRDTINEKEEIIHDLQHGFELARQKYDGAMGYLDTLMSRLEKVKEKWFEEWSKRIAMEKHVLKYSEEGMDTLMLELKKQVENWQSYIGEDADAKD